MEYAVNTYYKRFSIPPTPAFKQYALKRATNACASIGTFDPVFLQLRPIIEPPAY